MNNGTGSVTVFRTLSILTLATAFAAVAGCFKEPRPAFATAPAEAQVYLKEKGLAVLSVEDVHALGQVFIDDRAGEGADVQPSGHDSDPCGHFESLADRVAAFDPASLTYLNLDYNELTNVDAVVSFTGLKWLRLNGNRLSALPDLSALKRLRRIYLKGNAFTSVPEALRPGALPALDSIDLSDNPISEVPEWLAQREGLAHLSLSNTDIVRLPDDLSAWKSLKSLQLGGLRLKDLAELKRIRDALPSTTVVF